MPAPLDKKSNWCVTADKKIVGFFDNLLPPNTPYHCGFFQVCSLADGKP